MAVLLVIVATAGAKWTVESMVTVVTVAGDNGYSDDSVTSGGNGDSDGSVTASQW
jgi:hypothetical protein